MEKDRPPKGFKDGNALWNRTSWYYFPSSIFSRSKSLLHCRNSKYTEISQHFFNNTAIPVIGTLVVEKIGLEKIYQRVRYQRVLPYMLCTCTATAAAAASFLLERRRETQPSEAAVGIIRKAEIWWTHRGYSELHSDYASWLMANFNHFHVCLFFFDFFFFVGRKSDLRGGRRLSVRSRKKIVMVLIFPLLRISYDDLALVLW